MNAKDQITVLQWFRLPKAERRRRATEFRAADRALQALKDTDCQTETGDESELFLILNGRVNDLWPTVPWWCRW